MPEPLPIVDQINTLLQETQKKTEADLRELFDSIPASFEGALLFKQLAESIQGRNGPEVVAHFKEICKITKKSLEQFTELIAVLEDSVPQDGLWRTLDGFMIVNEERFDTELEAFRREELRRKIGRPARKGLGGR